MSASVNGAVLDSVNGEDFSESSDSVRACEMSKRVLTRSEGTGVKLFLLNSTTSTFHKWVGNLLATSGLVGLNKTQTKSFISLCAGAYVTHRRTMLPAQAKEEVKASFGNYAQEARDFYYL